MHRGRRPVLDARVDQAGRARAARSVGRGERLSQAHATFVAQRGADARRATAPRLAPRARSRARESDGRRSTGPSARAKLSSRSSSRLRRGRSGRHAATSRRGCGRLEASLALAGASDEARARGLYAAGILHARALRYEHAESLHREAVELSRRLGDEQGLARALNSLGIALYHLRRLPESEAALAESLELKRRLHDERGAAIALLSLGNTAMAAGDSRPRRAPSARGARSSAVGGGRARGCDRARRPRRASAARGRLRRRADPGGRVARGVASSGRASECRLRPRPAGSDGDGDGSGASAERSGRGAHALPVALRAGGHCGSARGLRRVVAPARTRACSHPPWRGRCDSRSRGCAPRRRGTSRSGAGRAAAADVVPPVEWDAAVARGRGLDVDAAVTVALEPPLHEPARRAQP